MARDERGNFAVMAALLIGLLAITGGAAVSFTRAAAAGRELQALATPARWPPSGRWPSPTRPTAPYTASCRRCPG
jgi:hypothetical protein